MDGVDGPALAGAEEVDPAVAVWIAANPARADGQHARNLRAWARLAGARLSILRKGDRIVAMALALPGRADGGAGDLVPGLVHLTGVCVHPDRQRHGLGREVLGFTLARARTDGYRRAGLWVDASNTPALRFFEAAGFAPSGDTDVDEYGQPMTHLLTEFV